MTQSLHPTAASAAPAPVAATTDGPDALDLKLQAIEVVESMQYPDPDRTAP